MVRIIKQAKLKKKLPKKLPMKKKVIKVATNKNKNKTKIKIKKISKKVSVKTKTKTKKVLVKTKLKKNISLKRTPIVPKQLIHTTKLERHSRNPIIEPTCYPWESKATFNPSAFLDDGIIHIIYRAVGESDISVLGYASTYDGVTIEERPTYCIYQRYQSAPVIRSGPSIEYISGGGWSGGCEDPRVTLIGDTLYMLYTAFDGWGSVRIALTSILLSDFKKKKWHWKKPVLISPPGEINKNWVLFPEKINGKFAILHSFYPKIRIDYFDSLDELDGTRFIKSNNTRPIDYTRTWDSWFRGVGPAPLKIKEGWLVVYHAMDHHNPDRYRMGVLILDEKDPTKILYRSSKPILEPEHVYENEGHKWGVIYACGAVIKEGILMVYYGGADTCVCVAQIALDELLNGLKNDAIVKLKNTKMRKK